MPPQTASTNEPELRDFLLVLWRRKWLILVTVVVITAATYVFSSQLPKRYEASTSVAVKPGNVDTSLLEGAPLVLNSTSLAPVVSQLQTTTTARTAARYLKPRPSNPRALLGAARFVANDDAGLIVITGKDSSPKGAADIANAFAKATVFGRGQQAKRNVDLAIKELQREINNTQAAVDRRNLSAQLERLKALRASQGTNASILEPAFPPATATSPQPKRNTLVAFLVSILIGVGLAFLLEKLDRRIRNEEELEDVAGIPLLTSVPRSAFPQNGVTPFELGPHEAEAFRRLRSSLIYFNVSREIKTVLVTSPGEQEGKTTVAINLALAAARQGKRVLLVDADLHRPQVHIRLSLPSSTGLSSVLSGTVKIDDTVQEVEAGDGTLLVLAAGPAPPNPSELLASERMAAVLETPADLIVVDSAPVLGVSDAIPLIERSSGVLVIGRVNSTTRDAIRRVIQLVRSAHGTPLGVVATGVKTPHGYAYGYGYGAGAAAPSGNGIAPVAEERTRELL